MPPCVLQEKLLGGWSVARGGSEASLVKLASKNAACIQHAPPTFLAKASKSLVLLPNATFWSSQLWKTKRGKRKLAQKMGISLCDKLGMPIKSAGALWFTPASENSGPCNCVTGKCLEQIRKEVREGFHSGCSMDMGKLKQDLWKSWNLSLRCSTGYLASRWAILRVNFQSRKVSSGLKWAWLTRS